MPDDRSSQEQAILKWSGFAKKVDMMAMECPNCADYERSAVKTVHPSRKSLVFHILSLIVGSMGNTIPGSNFTPVLG
jgi:hypothetical protein